MQCLLLSFDALHWLFNLFQLYILVLRPRSLRFQQLLLSLLELDALNLALLHLVFQFIYVNTLVDILSLSCSCFGHLLHGCLHLNLFLGLDRLSSLLLQAHYRCFWEFGFLLSGDWIRRHFRPWAERLAVVARLFFLLLLFLIASHVFASLNACHFTHNTQAQDLVYFFLVRRFIPQLSRGSLQIKLQVVYLLNVVEVVSANQSEHFRLWFKRSECILSECEVIINFAFVEIFDTHSRSLRILSERWEGRHAFVVLEMHGGCAAKHLDVGLVGLVSNAFMSWRLFDMGWQQFTRSYCRLNAIVEQRVFKFVLSVQIRRHVCACFMRRTYDILILSLGILLLLMVIRVLEVIINKLSKRIFLLFEIGLLLTLTMSQSVF